MSVYKPKGSPYFHYDFLYKRRRYHGSTGTGDRRKAEEIERAARRGAKEDDARIAAAEGQPMTWGVAAARFHDEVSQHYGGRNGADGFEAYLTWLTEQIGVDRLLTEINGSLVAKLVARRRGHGVKPSTVNRTVTEPLRRVLRRASLVWGCVVPSIAWGQQLLAEPTAEIRELSREAEAKAFAVERDDYTPALQFAILSGCRLEEIVRLEWEAVDFGERQIRVHGKGDKYRLIPLTPELRYLLWSQRSFHETAVFTYVCKRADKAVGRVRGARYPITYEGLKTRWRRTKAKARIKDRFHDLRHTFATRVLRGSGNLKAVSKLLGHADLKTTSRYAGVLMDDLRNAMMSAKATAPIPEKSPEMDAAEVEKPLKPNIKPE